jgi:ParB-like chromosome segregation protein Spo0J
MDCLRSLDAGRLNSVMQAIRARTALPPVVVIRKATQPIATLLDGAHRYFASVATGLVEIPVYCASKEEAEVCYRYGVD